MGSYENMPEDKAHGKINCNCYEIKRKIEEL
jgi:hypothetical protein